MNQQREMGKSVSHLGQSGRDWLSGLKRPRAQGSGCHLAEPQEDTLAQSCLNRRHQHPLPTNAENESQGGSLSKAGQKPALPIFPASTEVPCQMILQMRPPPLKKQWILFSFNSPVPAKKLHCFKETEWTLNKHIFVLLFALELMFVLTAPPLSTDYLSGYEVRAHQNLLPWEFGVGAICIVFGTEADAFSLKKDMKPGPSSPGSLCWHFLKLQGISDTSSHNFCIPCSGLEFQSFSAAVLVWMLIK